MAAGGCVLGAGGRDEGVKPEVAAGAWWSAGKGGGEVAAGPLTFLGLALFFFGAGSHTLSKVTRQVLPVRSTTPPGKPLVLLPLQLLYYCSTWESPPPPTSLTFVSPPSSLWGPPQWWTPACILQSGPPIGSQFWSPGCLGCQDMHIDL